MTRQKTSARLVPGLVAGLAVALATLSGSVALADTATATDWIDETQVRVRLVDGGPAGQGKHRLGFEIDLSEGWKTYWRHPGETGVAPHFSWDKSFNVASVTAYFPAPTRFIDSDMVSFGYKSDVVLPLEVDLSKPGPALVQLDVTYAVCADICLPLQASFELALNAEPDKRGTFLVERALRKVPRDVPPAALKEGVRLAAADESAAVDVLVPMAGADAKLIDVFAEGPGGWHVPPARRTASDGDIKTFRLDLAALPEDKRGPDARLRLTIVHPAGAFEQTIPIPDVISATD